MSKHKFKSLMQLYKDWAQPSTKFDDFEIWSIPTKDTMPAITAWARGKVIESARPTDEVSPFWQELAEVAEVMNREDDGNFYYVARRKSGLIVLPPFDEMRGVCDGMKRGWVSEQTLSTAELMTFALLIGGDWYDLLYS